MLMIRFIADLNEFCSQCGAYQSKTKYADNLKPSLIKAISIIMGLILAVIAVQMLINGIFNVIKEFPK